MKILFVYPEYPVTFWGFQYALKFISKKASFPPLGLLTVAAMLPEACEKKLVDMNVETLSDRDIAWADCVFISAMVVQKVSAKSVIARCRSLGVKIAAGGPLFTSEPDEFDDVDYLVLNEGEITVPAFMSDLEKGGAKHLYTTDEYPDLSQTPVPDWSLLNKRKYATMSIQYSRGCPFNCDFCNITSLFGHKPRTKEVGMLLNELDALYRFGWRGGVFFVDDNFIGNKQKLKEEILPAITGWMKAHRNPFVFLTETSINLADDDELMEMMVNAGFNDVFVGIETPDENSLAECNKLQNKNRDLIQCVKRIQHSGLEVQGGFIVGFDSDNPGIFARLVGFIQDSGIVTAMVGLLNAPRGTGLYQRLSKEGRLAEEFSGDNTNFSMNFTPKMDRQLLVKGYRNIVETIYSPKYYYARVKTFLKEYGAAKPSGKAFKMCYVAAFFKSVFRLGIVGKERRYFWQLLFWSLFRRPKVFADAVKFSIYGYHFRRVYNSN
jgi:radical SAM superfamily enzyme YgiQ (UPF0313 family)